MINDKNYISNVMQDKGYNVIEIDRKMLNKGPFWYKNNNQEIYKIIYTENGIKKSAWVRIGPINKKWVWE